MNQHTTRRQSLVGAWAFAAIFVWLVAPPTSLKLATALAAEGSADSWQVIYIGNQRIGYQHGREQVEVREKRKVIVSVSESHFQIKRFGQDLSLSTSLRTEETEDGDLLRFAFEMKNPPAQITRTEGLVDGSDLELISIVAGKSEKRRIAWEPNTKSPAYPDRQMRGKPLKSGEVLSTKVFLPEFNKFSKVSFAADDFRPVKLLDGKEHSLVKVKVSFSALPENNSRQYMDSDGHTKMTETDMLGAVARAYEVTRDVALEAIAGAELDLAVSTLIRIDSPIVDAHRKKRIVYRISSKDESPEKAFVNGGTQQIKRLSDAAIEMTVSTKAIPPVNSRPVSTDAKYPRADPGFCKRAIRPSLNMPTAAGGETDPSRIATRLEKYVHDKLTKKNFSTAMASAAEVAHRMEGDCTEHAVLLAAMLRSKKVPSRIAAGLVYVESLNSFGGHMWTEAFLAGEWIPLDATMGRGGIGAAHLKMAESALDEDSPLPVTTFLPLYNALGKLKIEIVKVE